MRRAFLIHERWVYAVFDKSWLVLYRLMDDGVQAMIGHDLQVIRHQLILRFEMLVVAHGIGILLETILGTAHDLGEFRRRDHLFAGFKRRVGASSIIILKRLIRVTGT